MEIQSDQHHDKTDSNKLKRRDYLKSTELGDILGITNQGVLELLSRYPTLGEKQKGRFIFRPEGVREEFIRRGLIYPKQTIAFQNLKGGSSKTTSAYNLAIRLSHLGARVLCVDADFQGNLTLALAGEIIDKPVLVHILSGDFTLEECIIPVQTNLDLVPSDLNNSAIDTLIAKSHINYSTYIQQHLESVRNRYDFILIDASPSLSALNASISMASDLVIIPVNPDRFSRYGMELLTKEFKSYEKSFGKAINYKILLTKYDAREEPSQIALSGYIESHYQSMFNLFIKKNAGIEKAYLKGVSVFDISGAPAAEEYDGLARILLNLNSIKSKKGRVGNA